VSETAYDRVLAKLAGSGAKVQTKGEGSAKAQCPAHDDRDPSLEVTRKSDKVLVNCHAGCDTGEVLAALDLTPADLFDKPIQSGNGRRHTGPGSLGDIVATSDYTDEARTLLYQSLRYVPKDFRVRRPDGHGGWIWNIKGVRNVLYRLPKVIEAVAAGKVIFLVEGEKDVLALERLGAVATTAALGASNFHLVDATPLRGATVVAVVDNDDGAGRGWAALVRAKLDGLAQSLVFVEAKVGKDSHDHVAAGHGLDDFQPLDLSAKPSESAPTTGADPPESPVPSFALLPVRRFAEVAAEVDARGPRKWLIRGIWPAGDYGVHGAEPKAGKTWNALDLSVSVASGTPWLGAVPVDTTGPVLVFAGEGGDGNIVRRLRAIAHLGLHPRPAPDQRGAPGGPRALGRADPARARRSGPALPGRTGVQRRRHLRDGRGP
jgi:hypothetical protein